MVVSGVRQGVWPSRRLVLSGLFGQRQRVSSPDAHSTIINSQLMCGSLLRNVPKTTPSLAKFVRKVKHSRASHYIDTYPDLVDRLLNHHVPELRARLERQTSYYLQSLALQQPAPASTFHSPQIAQVEIAQSQLSMGLQQVLVNTLTQDPYNYAPFAMSFGFHSADSALHREDVGSHLSPTSINSDVWLSTRAQEGGEDDVQDHGWMQSSF